jgi:hypothetical protein
MLEHGFTYNVSPSGLYVRTLAPPREDRVRIDVLAPGTEQPVRLEGRSPGGAASGDSARRPLPQASASDSSAARSTTAPTWARACTALLVNRAAPRSPARRGPCRPRPRGAPPPSRRDPARHGRAREGAIPAPPAAPATPKPPATSPTPPGPPVVTSGARARPRRPGTPVAVGRPGGARGSPRHRNGPRDARARTRPAAAVPPDPAPPTPDPVASPPLPDASDTPDPDRSAAAAVLTRGAGRGGGGRRRGGGRTSGRRGAECPGAPGDGETAAHAPQRVPVPSDLPVRRESQRPSHESGRSERVGATRNPAAARAASHPPRGRARGGGRRAAHAAASRASSAPARPRAAVPRSVLFGLLLGVGGARHGRARLVVERPGTEPAPRLPPVPPDRRPRR